MANQRKLWVRLTIVASVLSAACTFGMTYYTDKQIQATKQETTPQSTDSTQNVEPTTEEIRTTIQITPPPTEDQVSDVEDEGDEALLDHIVISDEEITKLQQALLNVFKDADKVCYDMTTDMLFVHSAGSNIDWSRGWYVEYRTDIEFAELSNNSIMITSPLDEIFNQKYAVDVSGLKCVTYDIKKV